MADTIIKIITPATSFDLLTVAEAKIALGIAASDISQDALLAQQITTASDVISVMCCRIFAREKVSEVWRDSDSRRIYLSHWPITKEDDIELVESPVGTAIDPDDYELEEASGKLELFGSRVEPIRITYTGGYSLPDYAPASLKWAAELAIRAARTQAARASTAGLRMVAHKESRIMYHPDATSGGSGGSQGATPEFAAIKSLLQRYMRLEC